MLQSRVKTEQSFPMGTGVSLCRMGRKASPCWSRGEGIRSLENKQHDKGVHAGNSQPQTVKARVGAASMDSEPTQCEEGGPSLVSELRMDEEGICVERKPSAGY